MTLNCIVLEYVHQPSCGLNILRDQPCFTLQWIEHVVYSPPSNSVLLLNLEMLIECVICLSYGWNILIFDPLLAQERCVSAVIDHVQATEHLWEINVNSWVLRATRIGLVLHFILQRSRDLSHTHLNSYHVCINKH